MTWGCVNQYLVSLHKLSPPLQFSATRVPPAVTLHFCLSNDLTYPFTSLHQLFTPISCFPRDHGTWTSEGKGQAGSALSGCFVSFHLHLSLLFPTALSFLSLFLLLYSLHWSTSFLFASLYLHPPERIWINDAAHSLPSCVGWDPMEQFMLGEYWWQQRKRTELGTQRHLADGQ